MTLTEFSYYLRRALPAFLVLSIFLILIYFLIQSILGYLESRRIKPLPINPIFNKLPRIKLKDKVNYPINPVFILDNIEGRPVTATDSARVFFLPPHSTRIGYLQSIYLIAKNLGFDTETVRHKLKNTEATFEDTEKKLALDITNFNFAYKYKFEGRDEIFEDINLLNESQIKENAKDFLRLMGRYPKELTQGKENLTYLFYDAANNEFNKVKKPSEANSVEVDFFRPEIDGVAVVSPRYFNTSNFVVMSLKDRDNKVLKAQIRFFEKADNPYGVYPVKSGDKAYEDLKQKKGVVVSSGTNSNQITIKKMFISYFDPDFYQEYLQPIYVFLGENGFVAYIDATVDEYME